MVPHPALGYAMVALAATLFAINGTVVEGHPRLGDRLASS